MGLGFVFCDERKRTTQSSQSSETSQSQSTEHKLIRVSQSLPRNPGRRHPHLPCFYPHSKWATSGPRCMLGFDLKPRSITAVTGPGLLGSCHLKSGLLDQVTSRSLPNKAVDVIADKLSGDRLIFASFNS